MGLRGGPDDGQPEAGAFLAGTIACLVQASEATEGPFGIFGGNPWPVVGHGEHRPPAVVPHRHAYPAGRVSDRVVQQVHQQPGQRVGSPETIARKLRRFRSSHIDQVILLNQAGKNTHEHICESLELFAKEVMPEFKHDPEHEAWKKGVLDGSIKLEEIDTEAFKDRYGKLAVNVAPKVAAG